MQIYLFLTKTLNLVKLVFIILFIFLLDGCDINDSRNVVLSQAYNSNKSRIAVVFLKENGATIDNSLQVSIFSSNHKMSDHDVGNVLTTDSNHDSGTQSENSISILWHSEDTVIIKYDKSLRTFTKESYVEGVTVLYESK